MKKLCAYNHNGTPINELNNYSNDWLNGLTPYILIEDEDDIPEGYSDITSIINLDKFCAMVSYTCSETRGFIKALYENLNREWNEYSHEEKHVIAKYFLVEKDKRDLVLSPEEQEMYNHFKIYHFLTKDALRRNNIIDKFAYKLTPKGVDYKKDINGRLHPEYVFDDMGFLTETIYYENVEVEVSPEGFSTYSFSNPIVKYEASYVVSNNGYVATRSVKRSWYLMDGTLSEDSKDSLKVYEPLTARSEGRRRRKNLINRLLIEVVGLFVLTSPDLNNVEEAETDAISFMHDMEVSISAYYESGTQKDSLGNPCQLIQNVTTHGYSRLDNWVPGTSNTVSIRMFILSRLNPQ